MKKNSKKILIIMFFIVFFSVLNAHNVFASFSYKASIVVDHTKVPNADQTNFPVLVSGTYAGAGGVPDLRTVGNGGKVQNANGYDIQFFSDSGLTTRIPAERESYNATTGAVNFWVKKTLLTASNTTIYVAYGDASISTDPNADATYGKTSVWDGGYKAVYHLPDGTTPSFTDSTTNANNGVNTGTVATAGQIDGAVSLNGTNQYVQLPTSSSLNISGNITLEAWVYPTGSTNYQGIIVKSSSFNVRQYSYYLTIANTSSLFLGFGGSNVGAVTLSSPWVVNAWNDIVVTADGTNIKSYLNGALVNTTASALQASTSTTDVYLGWDNPALGFSLAGNIDEPRISNSIRDANWIATEYNNQNAPASFYTMGSETSNGSTVIKTIIGVVKASVKLVNGLVIASMKSFNGVQ